MAETVVEIATSVTPELIEAVQRLLPQLSSSAPPPTAEDIGEIIESPATVLFVARVDGRIVGCLTLILFRIPSGRRAWIEDVVVDEEVRGHGVGAALNRAAIEQAQSYGARTVDLTSRPLREAANRLYQSLGFELRNTNVYRHGSD